MKALLLLGILFPSSSLFSQDTIRITSLIDQTSNLIDNANYSLAEKKADSIITLSNLTNYKFGIAQGYNLKGVIYRDQTRTKEALENFLQSISIYEAMGLRLKMAGLYINIGSIYAGLNENKMALTYYFKAVNIFKEQSKTRYLGTAYNNIGTTYERMGQFNSSNHYLTEALKISKRETDTIGIAMTLHNMGVNFQSNGNVDTSISYFNRSLFFLKKFGEGPGHIYNYSELGHSFLIKNNLVESEKYLLKALAIIYKNQQNPESGDIFAHLSDLYEKKGDYKKALLYHKKYLNNKDSLSDESLRNEIVKRDLEHDFARQREITQQQQRSKEVITQAKIDNQKKIIYGAVIALGIVSLLVILVFRGYNQKRKANDIISKQKELVEEKNSEILSSIYYAKRIQTALLTSENYIKKRLENFFIFYKPKDIVSGDFYWGLEHKGIFYLVVADCTGHGVPGAFMSLLNISILNELIIEKGISSPEQILNEARKEIIKSLNPEGGDESKDGMDCILCAFDLKNMKMKYACANNAFYIVRNNELIISETDKMPVGKSHDDVTTFSLHEFQLQKNDMLYLITDGYADQFGGPKGKKYKYLKLQQLVVQNSTLDLATQKTNLYNSFQEWKGELEQVDDVCIVGIRV